MANLSIIQIIGNIGRDAELRMTPAGKAVAEFGVAVNRVFNANGARKEETDWYNVSVWGKQADIAAQYAKKGGSIFVSGRFTPRTYVDKSGANRVSYDISADSFQMLGARADAVPAGVASGAADDDQIPF